MGSKRRCGPSAAPVSARNSKPAAAGVDEDRGRQRKTEESEATSFGDAEAYRAVTPTLATARILIFGQRQGFGFSYACNHTGPYVSGARPDQGSARGTRQGGSLGYSKARART